MVGANTRFMGGVGGGGGGGGCPGPTGLEGYLPHNAHNDIHIQRGMIKLLYKASCQGFLANLEFSYLKGGDLYLDYGKGVQGGGGGGWGGGPPRLVSQSPPRRSKSGPEGSHDNMRGVMTTDLDEL